MKIEVTQRYIELGIPRSTVSCPVALAVRRQLPDENIEVGDDGLWVNLRLHELPRSVRQRIKRFDQRKNIRPFTFELEID